jgi:hypothetical protein
VNSHAILKEQMISSPLLLLKTAIKNPGSIQVQPDEMFRSSKQHVIALSPKEDMPSVKIFFDNNTFLPSKVETIEDDPIHGDVPIEASFDDWREKMELCFPS